MGVVSLKKIHKEENEMVEFVEYTGKYPNLCSGILTLKINGVVAKFGNVYKSKTALYPRFWCSGGNCGFSNGYMESYINRGEWLYDGGLPHFLKRYEGEIMRVFNENVPYGCCGGCL